MKSRSKKSIITLTTDFGLSEAYAGSMKGAILGINPEAKVVDITHSVPPGDILHGAYVLFSTARYFPRGTIHLAVVDPGVGSKRRAVACKSAGHIFVGPDNGLLSLAAKFGEKESGLGWGMVELTNRRYFRPEISRTFHGRDIFAPVAAYLSLGTPLSEMGRSINDPVVLDEGELRVSKGLVAGRVIHIDSFGNLITNIDCQFLKNARPQEVIIKIGRKLIKGLSGAYAEKKKGGILAVIGSNSTVEISVNTGRADKVLGAGRGTEVEVEFE